MKSKEQFESKPFTFEKPQEKTKPKSLRPMRSLVASRSFKPKTLVASMPLKLEEQERRN
jgi:hypothetical protein